MNNGNGTHRNGNGNGNGTATAVRRNGNGTRPRTPSPSTAERDLAPASVEALHWDALAPRVTEALAQPLDPQLISQRKGRGGRKFDYIEGHTAIDQANRIFGFGGWGYDLIGDVTLRPIEQTNSRTGEVTSTPAYSAVVRVTVPGAPSRTDVGFQPVAEESPEGHETAFKGAVTDALKRALRSFGDRFGNGLYGDPPTTNSGNRRESSRPTERQAQSTAERESQSASTGPRACAGEPDGGAASAGAPGRPAGEPRRTRPSQGRTTPQVLRGQLIELSAQQGFSEQQLGAAVETKTGRLAGRTRPGRTQPADRLGRRQARTPARGGTRLNRTLPLLPDSGKESTMTLSNPTPVPAAAPRPTTGRRRGSPTTAASMSAPRRSASAAARSGTRPPEQTADQPDDGRDQARARSRAGARTGRRARHAAHLLDGHPVRPRGPLAGRSPEAGAGLVVSGHPDATGAIELFGDERVIEVKTRGPEAFKHWRTLGAERSHPESVAQAACYSLGLYGEVPRRGDRHAGHRIAAVGLRSGSGRPGRTCLGRGLPQAVGPGRSPRGLRARSRGAART